MITALYIGLYITFIMALANYQGWKSGYEQGKKELRDVLE